MLCCKCFNLRHNSLSFYKKILKIFIFYITK